MHAVSIVILGGLVVSLSSQVRGTAVTDAPASLIAHFLTETIRIDGDLQESTWNGEGNDRFLARYPVSGMPARYHTTSWIAYDRQAIYIAVYMQDPQPDLITTYLCRRDSEPQTDRLIVFLDTWNDNRNAYFFMVNPSGCRGDGRLFDETDWDYSWNGVWDSATRIQDDGWTVEMRIPFAQLRFPQVQQQTWGINIERFVEREHLDDHLIYLPDNEQGFISRFPDLIGMEGIQPGHQFETLLYGTTRMQQSPDDSDNPFWQEREWSHKAGFDLRWGVSSQLMLNATVLPDFGQVEVDPAELNLGVNELWYEEKRPFFVEGADYFRFGSSPGININFNWSDPALFYSRRIGAAPGRVPDREGADEFYFDMPVDTRILGAGKMSGEVRQLETGLLLAATAGEDARVERDGVRTREAVEPAAGFGVLRLGKQLANGRAHVGLLATGVQKDLITDRMRSEIPREAYTAGLDAWAYLGPGDEWVLESWLAGATTRGSEEAIVILQEAPQRYFQRPDATHVRLDSTRTSLNGWASRTQLSRVRGNLQFHGSLGVISPGFDVSQTGFQGRSDAIVSHLFTGYRWLTPERTIRQINLNGALYEDHDFAGNLLNRGVRSALNITRRDFSGMQLSFGAQPERDWTSHSRGGPKMRNPSGWNMDASIWSGSRGRWNSSAWYSYWTDARHNEGFHCGMELNYQAGPRLSLGVGPEFTRNRVADMWYARVADVTATHTWGTRHIFSVLHQETFEVESRVSFLFSPFMSLQMFLRPYLAAGDYSRLHELRTPGTQDFLYYGEDGSYIILLEGSGKYRIDPDGSGEAPAFDLTDHDFNFKALQVNLVYRWEFRPGSEFYLVWVRSGYHSSHSGILNVPRDLQDLLQADTDDTVQAKFTWWLNI